ncbi:RHOD [Musa troglodytarum]|uniref:RHOD n=1 Tax=Musa troglodytarum TaxID=320322 RepID=A0A9E7KLQ3_9LILI|nr:RHOD [Musa troglodytarum]URE23588.1 RHOD [Musa troglodytarum]
MSSSKRDIATSMSGRKRNSVAGMQWELLTFLTCSSLAQGCLSGKRSSMAATELSNAGFTGITDVSGGYSAWVENGLPTHK